MSDKSRIKRKARRVAERARVVQRESNMLAVVRQFEIMDAEIAKRGPAPQALHFYDRAQ